MEKFLNPYDKEYMKKAILKHEETFREQVYELHRLYRIQKMLMKNIRNSKTQGQEMKRNNTYEVSPTQRTRSQMLDLERPAEDYTCEENGNGVLDIEDESEIELTLGPSIYIRRKKSETPINSDSGPSFSSSSTGSSQVKRTNTRTTRHHQMEETREGLRSTKWGPIHEDRVFQSGIKSNFDMEEQQQQLLRQERLKQPPWLLHVLSLNMT
ncbi:hypothetical protein RJ641_010178 [Dillenia turbinata]|uniref:Uncharacterized protein n=1 Tax=Dillenia turbinata TaxID=194707 RepID=A0AAN8UVT2_9MAGN